LKVRGDEQSVTNSGRLFHARGPATATVLSPSDERRVAGWFIWLQLFGLNSLQTLNWYAN